LDVTVTNLPTPVAPEVRIPFTERMICSLSAGQNGCRADSFRTVRFPRGTNTLVFQSISVEQKSDVSPQQFGVGFTTRFRGTRFEHNLPLTAGSEQQDGTGSARFEMRQVTLYHDGVFEEDGVVELKSVEFNFSLAVPVTSFGSMYAVVTGYFTWVEPD